MAGGAYGGRTNKEYGNVTRGKNAGKRHVVRGARNSRGEKRDGWESITEAPDTGQQTYRSSANPDGIGIPMDLSVPLPAPGGISSNMPGQNMGERPLTGQLGQRLLGMNNSFDAARNYGSPYVDHQDYMSPGVMGYLPPTGLDDAINGTGPQSLYDRLTGPMVPQMPRKPNGLSDMPGTPQYGPGYGVSQLPQQPQMPQVDIGVGIPSPLYPTPSAPYNPGFPDLSFNLPNVPRPMMPRPVEDWEVPNNGPAPVEDWEVPNNYRRPFPQVPEFPSFPWAGGGSGRPFSTSGY